MISEDLAGFLPGLSGMNVRAVSEMTAGDAHFPDSGHQPQIVECLKSALPVALGRFVVHHARAMDQENDAMAVVGRWPTLGQAYEYALVVLAMNQNCRVRHSEQSFELEVEMDVVPEVREELALYESEQVSSTSVPRETSPISISLLPALPWVAVLLFVFWIQIRQTSFEDPFLNSSMGIFAKLEFWRPFTSLFLHADFPHLLGNVVIGGVFCVLVTSILGAVRGWLLILLSGTIGNLLTAWSHWPEEFRSLGASTATFGALGILMGAGLRDVLRTHQYRRLAALIAPLGGGVTLLLLQGVSDGNTDVLGHFMGFGAGCVLGLLFSQRQRQEAKVAA